MDDVMQIRASLGLSHNPSSISTSELVGLEDSAPPYEEQLATMPGMQTLTVQTQSRSQMIELTRRVQQLVTDSGMQQGSVIVYVPHTTAGITINENADPDVVHDMLAQLDQIAPWHQPFYRHGEGNSAAHVKASMMGSSVTVLVEQGQLCLGTWQGLWFCEFDGPRPRKVWVGLNRFSGNGS